MLSKGYLPPIFKMSVLCNVLPYYGQLHEWKELLENISEETKTIWEKNSKALIYWGREFRKRINIAELKKEEICRSYLELYSLSFKFQRLSPNKSFQIFSTLPYLLNENEVIIYQSHDLEKDYYNIYFSKEESVVEILPAVQCPSLKKTMLRSSDNSLILSFIQNQLEDKAVVIKKDHEELIAYSIISSTLIINTKEPSSDWKKTNIESLVNKDWKVWDWEWRPRKLLLKKFHYHEELNLWEDVYNLLGKINYIQIHVYIKNNLSKLNAFRVIEKFQNWKFEIVIRNNPNDRKLYCSFGYALGIIEFTWKSLLFMFKGKFYAFKKEDDKMFKQEMSFSKLFKINKESSIVLVEIRDILFKDLVPVKCLEDIYDTDFIGKIQSAIKWVEGSNHIYSIVDTNSTTLVGECSYIPKKIEFFNFWSKIYIRVNQFYDSCNYYGMIKKFPTSKKYIFMYYCYSDKSIESFPSWSLVKELKEHKKLNAKIVWEGVEIDVKHIDDEEKMKTFIEKIKKIVKNRR